MSSERLMQIVAAQEVVTGLFRQFEEAQYAFVEEWGEYIPSNPEHEGFSATIDDVYHGQKLLMVDYGEGLIYPFEVVGSIALQSLTSEQLIVKDKRGTTRTLCALGIIPEYTESGEVWWPKRLTVVDEPGGLDYLSEFLYDQEQEAAHEAAERVGAYLQQKYLDDTSFFSSEGTMPWYDDD